MHKFQRSLRSIRFTLMLVLPLLLSAVQPAAASPAKGTLVTTKGTVTVKYVYFVKGPDTFDNKKITRRLIVTDQDLSAKIAACTKMSCSDSDLTSGVSIGMDAIPRLTFWMVMNGGLVQNSGTVDLASLKLTTDQPDRMAGKLVFDASGQGGPKADVDFDAPLLKTFTQ